MVSQRIVVYIEQELKRGYSAGAIRQNLLKYGYNMPDVDEALNYVLGRKKGLSKTTIIIGVMVIGLLAIAVLVFFMLRSGEKPAPYTPPQTTPPKTDVVPETPKENEPEPPSFPDEPETGITRTYVIEKVTALAKTNKQEALDFCASLQDEEYKDTCFAELAQSAESAICEQVIDPARKDACYMAYAHSHHQPDLCEMINNNYLRNSCSSVA